MDVVHNTQVLPDFKKMYKTLSESTQLRRNIYAVSALCIKFVIRTYIIYAGYCCKSLTLRGIPSYSRYIPHIPPARHQRASTTRDKLNLTGIANRQPPPKQNHGYATGPSFAPIVVVVIITYTQKSYIIVHCIRRAV
jgi:hypothetical protein